jgi:hypothetical protein
MLYYKQPYRLQSNFYLLTTLIVLLGGSILMGCGVADPIKPAVTPEANKQLLDKLVKQFREFGFSEEVLTELINLNEEKIKWPCVSCMVYNSLETNVCKVCGTLRPIDTSKQWGCKVCTFVNPLSAKTCEACSSEMLDQTNITKLAKISPQEENKKEECPVCFEEYELQKCGQYYCKQCKKAICTPCYQDILKSKSKSCPLCRYEDF